MCLILATPPQIQKTCLLWTRFREPSPDSACRVSDILAEPGDEFFSACVSLRSSGQQWFILRFSI